MKRLCRYISEYMGMLVLAAALLALVFPSVLQQIRPTVINYLLGVVMFGMGLTLNLQDFKIVFSRPKDVIIGCMAQFTIMPLLAWGLARAFQLDEALALGVVLVGCCPGGTASNVITYLAKGDLALSVGMTGVSTLLAPLLTPLLTWALAGKSVNVDVVGMLLSILWVVIVPIAVGLVIKYIWPRFTERATDYLPAFSSVAIAFIVAIIIAANANKLMAGGLIIVVVVMLHNICGLSLGYLIGRLLGLSESKKRAISIEVGMQNSGLASSLATIHFAAYPMSSIPGAIFSVWHNISGALVARLYNRKKKIKNIAFDLGGVVVALNYEQAVSRFEAIGLKDARQRLDAFEQKGIFGDLECGRITDEDFRRELSRLIGRELTHEECYTAWTGYIDHVPAQNLEALLSLRKRGYKVCLLSNTNPFILQWAEKDFDGKGHPISYFFDSLYLSYKCKVMKPNQEIFRMMLEGQKALPEETIFIDDGPRNVETAAAMGMKTLCPVNNEDWTAALENMLGER